MTRSVLSLQPILHGHGEGEIWGLACHPEKEVFLSASDDQTVRLWDVTSKVINYNFWDVISKVMIYNFAK